MASIARRLARPDPTTLVQFVVFGLLVLLWVSLSLATPNFLTSNNVGNILRQVSITAVIAFGALFPIIIAGIDLSVGSIAALAGVVPALLITNGFPLVPSLLVALLLCIAIGCLHGLATTRLGIPAFIITLAGLNAYRGFALLVSDGRSIAGMPSALLSYARGDFLGLSNLFWTMLVVGVALSFLLTQTRLGRYLFAIGSNLEAARRAGINVVKVTLFAYVVSATMAGLTGIMLVARLSVATPTAAQTYELSAIAAAVVGGASLFGGRGSVFGTFIGALLFTTIGNGANLLGIDPFWRLVAEGALIAIVVYLDSMQRRRFGGG